MAVRALTILAAAWLLATAVGGAKGTEPQLVDAVFGAIVDSLANKNAPPGRVPGRFTQLPIFPVEYDWSEPDRISRAVEFLDKHALQAWPHLVRHLNDKRYSLTFDETISAHTYYDRTVGDVCNRILRHWLTAPWPAFDEGDTYAWFHKTKNIPPAGAEKLSRWLAARPGESVKELQIESCDMAAGAIGTMEDRPVGSLARPGKPWKAALLSKFADAAEQLRAQPEPVSPRKTLRLHICGENEATRIRDGQGQRNRATTDPVLGAEMAADEAFPQSNTADRPR